MPCSTTSAGWAQPRRQRCRVSLPARPSTCPVSMSGCAPGGAGPAPAAAEGRRGLGIGTGVHPRPPLFCADWRSARPSRPEQMTRSSFHLRLSLPTLAELPAVAESRQPPLLLALASAGGAELPDPALAGVPSVLPAERRRPRQRCCRKAATRRTAMGCCACCRCRLGFAAGGPPASRAAALAVLCFTRRTLCRAARRPISLRRCAANRSRGDRRVLSCHGQQVGLDRGARPRASAAPTRRSWNAACPACRPSRPSTPPRPRRCCGRPRRGS